MIGKTSGIEKSVKCTAAISTAYVIAKPGGDDDTFSVASTSTDALIGIFQHTTSAAGEAVRIMLTGISPIVYGGQITRGEPLTADSAGKAVKATIGQSIIGYATVSGVANDIGYCLISPQILASNQYTTGNSFKGVAVAVFDPSANTAERTVAKHKLGVSLPDKAVITRAYYEVLTAFDSANDTATLAIGIDTQDEDGLLSAAAISTSGTTGFHECVQDGTAAKFLKCTASRELCVTVATEALTAGKLRLYAEYVMSE